MHTMMGTQKLTTYNIIEELQRKITIVEGSELKLKLNECDFFFLNAIPLNYNFYYILSHVKYENSLVILYPGFFPTIDSRK